MDTSACSICNDKDGDELLEKFHKCTKEIKEEEEEITILLENNNDYDEEDDDEMSEDDVTGLFEPEIELNESTTIETQAGGGKKFKCKECEQLFTQRSGLNRHMSKHTNIKPYICETCGAAFRLKHYLNSHVLTHTKTKPFQCDVCGKKYGRKKDMIDHFNRTHTIIGDNEGFEIKSIPIRMNKRAENDLFANFVGKNVPEIIEVRKDGDVYFSCSLCPKTFRKRRYIKDHVLVHSGDKPFMCQECGASFSQKGTLNRHMLQHSDLKPFKCDKCGASFKLKHYLTSHNLSHTSIRPHACDLCDSTFVRKYDLDAHVRLKHLRVQNYQCDKCGKQFTRSKLLHVHLLVHAKSEGPQCQICWRFFKTDERLEMHKTTHFSPQLGPYKCYICDSTFTRHTFLSKHLLKHTEDEFHLEPRIIEKIHLKKPPPKIHKCINCNIIFDTKDQFQDHVKIHDNYLPYQCVDCNKRFMRRSNLKSHSFTHSGVKNHKCQFCGRGYSQKHLLDQHTKRHHTHIQLFSCDLCEETFKYAKHLRKHVRVAHENDAHNYVEIESIVEEVDIKTEVIDDAITLFL